MRPYNRFSTSCEEADRLYERFGVPHIDTTHCSVEEISSRVLQLTGVPRRLRP